MIDEKKLIEKIEKMFVPLSTPDGSESIDIRINGYNECLVDVLETIKEQPKVGEWISCSDRLPEPYKVVLLCYIGFNDKVAYSDGIALVDYSGNWIWAFDENYEDEIKNDVIAWQPLPVPYSSGD